MAGRIFIAAILGGIVLFLWGAVAHMFLGLGDSSLKGIPNEETVLSMMKENITESGLYFFPWMDMKTTDKAAREAWTQKYKAGPSGLMVYYPNGMEPMSARHMIIQVITDILAVLFAAILLAKATSGIKGYFGRVMFMATFGLVSTFAISLPYWNWYGFPFSFVTASLIEQVVGFALAGLVLAWRIKPAVKPAA